MRCFVYSRKSPGRPEDFYIIKTVSKDPETEIAYLIRLFLTNFRTFLTFRTFGLLRTSDFCGLSRLQLNNYLYPNKTNIPCHHLIL